MKIKTLSNDLALDKAQVPGPKIPLEPKVSKLGGEQLPRGTTLTVDDSVGVDLCARGLARDVTPTPAAESEETPAKKKPGRTVGKK